MTKVLVTFVVLVASLGTAIGEVRFDRAFVPSGTVWWCNTVLCDRSEAWCNEFGGGCKKQQVAYAVIDRFHIATVFPTAAECESTRRQFAQREEVSACVAVGAKQPPPYKPLERGDGFWCFSLTMEGDVTSMCMRNPVVCQGAYQTAGLMPNTTATSTCQHHKTAWAYMTEDSGFRVDSAQFLTKEHCAYVAKHDAVAPCRELR